MLETLFPQKETLQEDWKYQNILLILLKLAQRETVPTEISEVLVLTRTELYQRGQSLEPRTQPPCMSRQETVWSLVTHLGVLMTIS